MPIIEFKIVSLDELFSLNIKNPDFQRFLEPERVDTIYNDIKTNSYVLGCITLCKFIISDEYLCIDGQHRFQALYRMNQENKEEKYNLQINLQIINVNTEEETRELYFKINQAKPVALPENYLLLDKPKRLVLKLKELFPESIKNYSRKRRPFITENDLLNILSDGIENFKEKSVDELLALILKFNQKISNSDVNTLKKKGDTKRKIEQWKRSIDGFYLGLYPSQCNWSVICGEEKEEKEEEKDIKIKISHLRKRVWEKYYQNNLNGLCPACDSDIDCLSYEISHNIPKSKGGSDHIDNMRVLCRSCNIRSGNRYTVDEWITFLKK